MKSMFYRLLLILLFMLFSFSLCAYPVKITDSKKSVNIGLSVEYYEDRNATLTLKDVIKLSNENKFVTTAKLPLNFGYSPHTYWVSFSVLGDTKSESGWVLDVPYAPLDYVTLYVPNGKGDYREIKNGDRVSQRIKQIKHRNSVFVLGEKLIPYKQYYLKVSSKGSVNIPIFLWTGAGFAEYVINFQTGLGIYLGIMLALLLYNIFLYFSIKDIDFLLCGFVLMCYLLVHAVYTGTAAQFFWPDHIWWANNSMVVFAVLNFLSIAVFTNSFLRLSKNALFFNRVMRFFIWYYSLMFLGLFTIGYRWTSVATAIMGIVLIVFVFIAAMVVFSRGYRSARLLLLAWTFFLLGMVLLLLKLMGVLPPIFFTEYSVQLGFIINGLLLSFALVDRVNLLRREKESAQTEAFEHLQKSEQMKTEFLEETEKLVDKRTRELANANERLIELASVDIHTGLANRRHFNEQLAKEFSRAKRMGTDLSLIVIEVDYFKEYNEKHGHIDGDKCLLILAEICKSCISRATDTVAKYGGEEFAVILTETNLEGALTVAESIRAEVESTCIPYESASGECITVSCGVACLSPMMQDRVETFIGSAERALAKAIRFGRNNVMVSSL